MDGQQATPLIGDYVIEDFYTERPYMAIYTESNRFLQNVMLNKTRDLAASLGFKGFMTAWKSFLAAQKGGAPISGDTANVTEFDEQPMELKCGAYQCSGDNVTRVNEYGVEVEVISHPIMPVMRVNNIETGESKLTLAYRRGQKAKDWRELTVPKDTVSSAQKIVSLANKNVSVTSENAREVVKFLNSLESWNYDDIPTQDSISHMGWTSDGRFMPYAGNITFDSNNTEYRKIFDEMCPTGSEKKWMTLAKQVRSGDSVPCRMALAAGFAAPLVKLLFKQSFFVHFWGQSGCGKTVGVMLAVSIWGNPELGGIFKTLSGTKVSFEILASFCRNLPVCLDELQVMKHDDRRNYDDIIYMLCEGVNKGRATKTGELQTQRRWATCMITTGEEPIVQDDSGDGAKLRTIDVNFRNTKFFGTDKAAKKAAELLMDNYGHAGRKYIEFLQRKDTPELLRSLADSFTRELETTIEAKQVNAAVTLLVADAIANMAIFRDGNSLSAQDIAEFLVRKDMPNASERCYDWLMGYFRANPRRFDAEDVNTGELWGKMDEEYVYVNPTIFRRILKKERNFSADQFLEWAKAAGVLRHDKGRFTWRLGARGSQQPYYALKIPREKEDEEDESTTNNGFAPVDAPPDMPF